MKPPVFTSGNAAFKKALNDVVEFAKRHGVNPSGVAGWSETADGWKPPGSSTSTISKPRQWQLKISTDGEGENATKIAQIKTGALYGLQFSGYNLGPFFDDLEWTPDKWITISDLDGYPNSGNVQVWLKLMVKIIGAPFTYYISPDQTETIYLPSQVDEATVELFFNELEDGSPEVITPTIDPDTGLTNIEGEYFLRIGSIDIENSSKTNDFTGPLGIGWCPPSGPYLVQLT